MPQRITAGSRYPPPCKKSRTVHPAPLRRGILFGARQQKPRLGGRGLGRDIVRRKPDPLPAGRKTYDARFRRPRQFIGTLRGGKPSVFW
jgi:hypothetical protein